METKMKILRVGDPHVQVSNLADSEKLFAFILATARKEKVDRIELLGDLNHNHAVLRVEVLNFWNKWLTILALEFETIVLVGNHDMVNQKDPSSQNSLNIYKQIKLDNLKIITEPVMIGKIAYVPYIHNPIAFIAAANARSGQTNLLVCHGTFDGAEYYKGFFAPDGIKIEDMLHKQIISGHIHLESEFGKVWYPGTGKWDTAHDANQNKSIWVCGHNEDGLLVSKIRYSTWGVVTPIMSYVWNEGEEQPKIADNVLASIEIVGSNTFVSKAKALFKGTAKIKTKVTDRVVRENRKSSASVLEFLDNSYKTTVDREKLKIYLKEKHYV